MRKKNRLILALDVESRANAMKVCRETKEFVDAIKVGYPLVLAAGLHIIKELKKFKTPIIADFKIADIPFISRGICELAVKNGADYVIVQGFAGEDVMKACSEVADIFVVAEMSHPGSKDFISKESDKIAKLARRYAYGIVAPATRPERVKKIRKIVGNLVIISPGVKAQGAEVGSAIKAGADFEIIGRKIYGSRNPRKAAQGFADILKKL